MDEKLHKWGGKEGSEEAMAVVQVRYDLVLEISHILHTDSSVFAVGLDRDGIKDVSSISGWRKQVMVVPLMKIGKTGLICSFERSDP